VSVESVDQRIGPGRSEAPLARGVIGNTADFGSVIPSSSLGGPAFRTSPLERVSMGLIVSNASTAVTPQTPHSGSRCLAAIILAAGRGTRMNSDLPKVAHPVAGRPMVQWVVDAVADAGASRIILVVGHGEDVVRGMFAGDDRVEFVRQDAQLGTGHATLCAREPMNGWSGDVLVLAGDGPLLRRETIDRMVQRQRSTDALATLATARVPDPTGYGRIVRDAQGRCQAIVEQKNLAPGQERIDEIYPSYACFDAQKLFEVLSSLPADSVTGEFYLTDVPRVLRDGGHRVELVDGVSAEDVLSINTPAQLAEVDAILCARIERAEAS